jgi:hypothetical protein
MAPARSASSQSAGRMPAAAWLRCQPRSLLTCAVIFGLVGGIFSVACVELMEVSDMLPQAVLGRPNHESVLELKAPDPVATLPSEYLLL